MNEKLYNALSQYVLSALGEDPTNEEIKAQYRPVFETVLKDDKFVEAFTSNPEETATALAQEIVKYQENAASQQEAIMAKKGARLMKLKKGGKKKCACGCELVEKKEAGGKVSSVCSCGCKVEKVSKKEEGGSMPKILAARAADAGVDFNYIPEEKARKESFVEVKKPTLIITEKPTLVKKKKLGLFSKKK